MADAGRAPITTHVVGLAERGDPAEAQEGAAGQAGLGLGDPAGEAVEDRAARDATGVEQVEGLLPRLPGVDHEGQVGPLGVLADLRDAKLPQSRS